MSLPIIYCKQCELLFIKIDWKKYKNWFQNLSKNNKTLIIPQNHKNFMIYLNSFNVFQIFYDKVILI